MYELDWDFLLGIGVIRKWGDRVRKEVEERKEAAAAIFLQGGDFHTFPIHMCDLQGGFTNTIV